MHTTTLNINVKLNQWHAAFVITTQILTAIACTSQESTNFQQFPSYLRHPENSPNVKENKLPKMVETNSLEKHKIQHQTRYQCTLPSTVSFALNRTPIRKRQTTIHVPTLTLSPKRPQHCFKSPLFYIHVNARNTCPRVVRPD